MYTFLLVGEAISNGYKHKLQLHNYLLFLLLTLLNSHFPEIRFLYFIPVKCTTKAKLSKLLFYIPSLFVED